MLYSTFIGIGKKSIGGQTSCPQLKVQSENYQNNTGENMACINRGSHFFHGRTHKPQHFSRPSKLFSASFMSALILSIPSSILSSCSVGDMLHIRTVSAPDLQLSGQQTKPNQMKLCNSKGRSLHLLG